MSAESTTASDQPATQALADLYASLINAWNTRNAAAFAACFAPDGNVVGFDGSQMNGQTEIEATLGAIFRDHVTAPYVTKLREIRLLTADVAIVRAVAGMIPPGQTTLNPAVHAIHTLVAQHTDRWRIALFQNTPAQFHGRPEAVQALTDELTREINHKDPAVA